MVKGGDVTDTSLPQTIPPLPPHTQLVTVHLSFNLICPLQVHCNCRFSSPPLAPGSRAPTGDYVSTGTQGLLKTTA